MSESEIIEGKFEESLATIPHVEVALSVERDPAVVLAEAHKAAKVLQEVIESKPTKVKFNGKTYLTFEDWQTVGRFYGVSAKIVSSAYVEYGTVKGFEARAVAVLSSNGVEVSGAEALCLNDEQNWKSKPMFQLKSMAQTRACAKALRNILAFVPVLAGYQPTPAEEMLETGSQEAANEVAKHKVLEHEKKHGKTAPKASNGASGEVTIVSYPNSPDGDVEITGSAMTLLNIGAKRNAKNPANRLIKYSTMTAFYDLCIQRGVIVIDIPETSHDESAIR